LNEERGTAKGVSTLAPPPNQGPLLSLKKKKKNTKKGGKGNGAGKAGGKPNKDKPKKKKEGVGGFLVGRTKPWWTSKGP